MKILIHCEYRVGSKSLCEWLQKEMNIPLYFEPLNIHKKDKTDNYVDIFKIKTDFITKISHQDMTDRKISSSFLENFFDKIIVLYRENTLEQAESHTWSIYTNTWHQDKDKTKFYKIDEEFLKEHNTEILEKKNQYDSLNIYYKNIKNCLQISYEEFYFTESGIKKVEAYLGIKTKTLPNSSNKLRNGTLSSIDRLKKLI